MTISRRELLRSAAVLSAATAAAAIPLTRAQARAYAWQLPAKGSVAVVENE